MTDLSAVERLAREIKISERARGRIVETEHVPPQYRTDPVNRTVIEPYIGG